LIFVQRRGQEWYAEDRKLVEETVETLMREYRRPLLAEQSESLACHVISTGASGLSYILGTLDKPGQAVRGVFAGNGFSSLKHLIPFSDSLGITPEKDHVSGRDPTDRWGLTDKRDKGWGSWGVGLVADVLTDPLTDMAFGAKHDLTGTGKALQKAGALKGWSGRAIIEGYHGVEPTPLPTGRTTSDIAHMADQGQRIAGTAAADAITPTTIEAVADQLV
jgi:hypothetical protein